MGRAEAEFKQTQSYFCDTAWSNWRSARILKRSAHHIHGSSTEFHSASDLNLYSCSYFIALFTENCKPVNNFSCMNSRFTKF